MVLTPSAGDLNLEQLAQLANRIMEVSPTLTITTTKTTTDNSTQLTAQVQELTCRLNEYTTQIASFINTFLRRPRHHPVLHDEDSLQLPITGRPIAFAGTTANSGTMQISVNHQA